MSHLLRADEILGAMLLTWHNLQYYQDLMAGLRDAIESKKLEKFVEKFEAGQKVGDIDEI